MIRIVKFYVIRRALPRQAVNNLVSSFLKLIFEHGLPPAAFSSSSTSFKACLNWVSISLNICCPLVSSFSSIFYVLVILEAFDILVVSFLVDFFDLWVYWVLVEEIELLFERVLLGVWGTVLVFPAVLVTFGVYFSEILPTLVSSVFFWPSVATLGLALFFDSWVSLMRSFLVLRAFEILLVWLELTGVDA